MEAVENDLAAIEREKYEAVWARDEYRIKCHSLRLWNEHRGIFPSKIESALDIGCGLGLLISAWNAEGIDGWGVDHAHNCLDPAVRGQHADKFALQNLWEMDLKEKIDQLYFDLGVCADVMEHIPTEKVGAVLERIARHCITVIFQIADFPSNFLGYDLHPTRKPLQWWFAEIQVAAPHGRIEVLEIPHEGTKYHLRWTP